MQNALTTKMIIRTFLSIYCICIGSLFAFAETTRTKPNILFIMADDLGKVSISCYGAEDIETPNIDALAAGGMKFNNAYSMPACTLALPCLQEIAAYGMGKPADVRVGELDTNEMEEKGITTFARLMKELGNATAAAGKWRRVNDFRIERGGTMKKHGFDELIDVDRCGILPG